MKKSACFIILILFCYSTDSIQAQIGFQANSEFKRELDNFNATYRSSWDKQIANYHFGYHSIMNNRLFLFNGNPQNAQDELSVQAFFDYKLTPNLRLNSGSDYYSFTNTQITTFNIRSGLFWDNEKIKINPVLGWSSDTRSNRTDNGLMTAIKADLYPFNLGGDFTASIQSGLNYTQLDPRTFQNNFIKGKTQYRIPELTLLFEGGYSFNQRDSYQPNSFFNRDVTNLIEKVLSDSTTFSVQMETKLSKNVRFISYANSLINIRTFNNKSLDETTENSLIDTEYKRQELNSAAQIEYNADFFSGSIGTRFDISGLNAAITNTLNITDEVLTRRNEQLRNTFFDQSNLEVFLKHEQTLTQNQSLNINASTSILRFDTPETNYDDRDELFMASDFTYTFQREKSFKASLLISGEAYHRVFLFRQRSIENNWRRSLRLQPSLIWLPTERLRLTNQFLVRANYTVFDFQDRDGTVRDQSSREWGVSHELRWEFQKNWFNTILFSRNQLLIGQLFWNEFAETPIDTLTTTRIETAFELAKNQNFFKLGIRVFIKDDYIPASVLRLQTEENELPYSRFVTGNQQTLQWGPTLSVRWQSSKYGEISLDGWLQLQYLRENWYLDVPEEFRAAFLEITAFRRTRIFPNLTIRTKLYL